MRTSPYYKSRVLPREERDRGTEVFCGGVGGVLDMTNNAVCPSGCNRIAHLPDTKLVLRHPLLDLSTMAQAMTKHIGGTWCSGITPAQHAGGPGFNPQRVHGCLSDSISQQSARLASGGSARFWKECISRESNPGHIDGNDVFCH